MLESASRGGLPGPGGGVCLVPGGCLPGPGGVLHAGGVWFGGVSQPGGWGGGSPCWGGSGPGGVSQPGGVLLARPPPVNRMTDRCKNITLAKTSFRPVIKMVLLTS